MNGSKHVSLSILVIVLAILSISTVLTSAGSMQSEMDDSMQGLVERLVEKMNDEPGLIVFVTFVNPLVEDEIMWGIGDPADELQRRIVEIGKDYLCFREIAGAADGRRCTPFSNIVSVTYLNN